MTDDSNSRYRPSDRFGRDPASNSLASDPLAELAKLIGQTDPFSELGARGPADDESRAASSDARDHDDPEPRYDDRPTDLPPWPPVTKPRDYDEYDDASREEPVYARHHDRHDYDEPQRRPEPSFDPLEPSVYDAEPPRRPRDLPGFEFPDLGFSRPDTPAEPLPDPMGLAAQEPPLFASRDDLPREIASDLPGFVPEATPYLRAEDIAPPHDDEFYDQAPRSHGRKGMVTVLAVLGLAVVGTAGAFGYRTLVSGPKSTALPPVIRASDEPSKVAPPPVSNEPANKLSYDRFGDRGQNERVVVREEKPIDTRELNRSSGPRVILPGAPIPSTTGPGGTVLPGNTGSASLGVVPSSPRTVPSALGEPRRVRTMQIRPDQADAAASPNQMAALPSLPQQVQAPAVQHDNTPPSVAVEPPPAAANPPQVRSRTSAPRPTSPRPAPPPSGADAPLSLSPDGSAELPPPGRSSAPARTSPASQPTRVASAPSGGGGYLVQVSSQRSEADAQSAYRSLSAKYSSVLGDRQHVIRRADLGSRGVFYRAMVGPFGSREEAIQLCGNLKAAGGDCVVQSN